LSRVELGQEPWLEFVATGGAEILRAYYEEHRVLRNLWKPHDPHHETFAQADAQGLLLVYVARLRGAPVGLLMITLGADLESRSHLMAQQGPWFVVPGAEVAKLGLGLKLMDLARRRLRELSVTELELHHPLVGRGARLARTFAHLGAVPCNLTYLLRP
jgi:hypothetical protein